LNAGEDPQTGRTCTICGEWKVFEDFHRNVKGPNGRHSQCRECQNQRKRDRRKTTPESPEFRRKHSLKTRYGMSLDDYDRKFSGQGYVCEICKEPPKRPCVDHNHTTGAIRGILCHRCNIALPYVEDKVSRARAITYLEKYSEIIIDAGERQYTKRHRNSVVQLDHGNGAAMG
jgi:hypothetical protein